MIAQKLTHRMVPIKNLIGSNLSARVNMLIFAKKTTWFIGIENATTTTNLIFQNFYCAFLICDKSISDKR